MASKAERRRRKAGRPIKEGVGRTDSGRISRAKDGGGPPPDQAGRDARVRIFGLSHRDAVEPKAGTFIGRMNIKKDLSDAQYDALGRYLRDRARRLHSIQAKTGLEKTSHSGLMVTKTDGEIAADAKRYEAAYLNARQAVVNAQLEHRNTNLIAAIQYAVEEDLDLPHMIADVRLVANALQRHYRIIGDREECNERTAKFA